MPGISPLEKVQSGTVVQKGWISNGPTTEKRIVNYQLLAPTGCLAGFQKLADWSVGPAQKHAASGVARAYGDDQHEVALV